MTAAPILEMRNVTKVFGGLKGTVATDNVSLTIEPEPPRVLSIVGESGSGKTTVARALLGLNPPTSGNVLYRGKDIYKLGGREMTTYRKEVQAIFQDPYGIYNPYYRIDRVFNMTIRKFHLAASKQERARITEEALRAVSLRPGDVLGRYPHQLSGGERQRVMLARAYMLRPKVIVADEPISMLDVAVRAIFMNILLDFKEKYGMSTLFITHDLSSAYYLGGDIMVMARGRVVEEGPAETVMNHPAHPYTQLLLRSIPSPDPDDRATGPIFARNSAPEGRLMSRDRCLFAERCPHVMESCWQKRPSMYPVGEQQAACFLHRPGSEASAAAMVAKTTAATRSNAAD
ncbi:MAG: ABC transporter ATP-binding protein [Chloroflexota bacterium]|nr:ABC transporter ATP-binding protein [Chloroflexota bacterium]